MPDFDVAPSSTRIAMLLEHVQPFATLFMAQGWPWRIVGGAARDVVRGVAAGDIDIEVVADDITAVFATIKATFAQAILVTSDKPVIRVRLNHQWFDVSVTLHHDVLVAAATRDFTMNALSIDDHGVLTDPYGGIADMRAGVIRHIGNAFDADPVRVLRVMRFAGMYGMYVAADTAAAAQAVRAQAGVLTAERVWGEWHAWAMRSVWPGAGLEALAQCGWLDCYPMLAALVDCPQDPIYHPEGDVWTHTCLVCDAAIPLVQLLAPEERLVVMLAALCHDLGKPLTTTQSSTGRIVSPGHATAGVPITHTFLQQIHAPERIAAPITALVREHMVRLGDAPSLRAVRRLAQRLMPASITLWGHITAADAAGRTPRAPDNPSDATLALAQRLGISDKQPAALLSGHDVLACGIAKGPLVGYWLGRAYDAQLDGAFDTHDQALAWLIRAIAP